jgi:hypothetical protein
MQIITINDLHDDDQNIVEKNKKIKKNTIPIFFSLHMKVNIFFIQSFFFLIIIS